MPDFDDIPDLPPASNRARRVPDVGHWQRVHGSPLTRREVEQRKRLAVVVSVVWIAVQFFAFGVRGDLSRLPWSYLFALCIAPMSAGILAVVLAVRGGSFGLGTRTALVSALAVLGPLSDFAKQLDRFGLVTRLAGIIQRNDHFHIDGHHVLVGLNQPRPLNPLSGNSHGCANRRNARLRALPHCSDASKTRRL